MAVSGTIASGKSTLARALAAHLGVRRIEADRVRAAILARGRAPGGRDPDTHEARWAQDFEAGFEDRVYAEVMRRAETVLARGEGLVLDACFPSRWWRGVARALARRHGLPFRLVECRVDAETQQHRLARRDAAGPLTGWHAIALRFAMRFEPPDELPPDEHIAVNTSGDVAAALETVLQRLPARRVGTAGARGPVGDRPPAAVTFDCWNTLLYEGDWSVAHARRVDAIVHATSVAREQAARAFDKAWERHMDQWRVGIATGARDVAYDVLEILGVEATTASLEPLVRDFQYASHSGRVLALEGAAETLEALVAAGVRCALVCDTGLTPGHVVRHHLARLGLLHALDVQIFSDEAGVPKPDPRVFRAALEPFHVAPGQAVHVGDLRRTDVVGARAVGMETIRLRALHDDTGPLPEADLVVDDHTALRAVLRGRGS